MILPIVNINGTSREELVEQRREVYQALRVVLEKLRAMSPNGRDFQTDATGAQFKAARHQHECRVKLIQSLREELGQEAIALQNQ
jgi:hypothetical protein